MVKGKRRRKPEKLVPGDPQEVEIVRWLFRQYAYTETSLRNLDVELNQRKVPSPKGAPWWGQGTIKKIINNRVYLGELVWNKRSMGKFFGVVDCKVERAKKKQRCQANGTNHWIVRPGCPEPLIDPATFERCQIRLVENRKRTRPARDHGFLLAGLLVCGHCQRRMIGRTSKITRKRNGKTYVYRKYCCGGYNTYGKSLCNFNTIDENLLVDVLVRKIQERFLKPANLDALRQEIRNQTQQATLEDRAKLKKLETQLVALDRQIASGTRRLLTEENEDLVPGLRAHLVVMHKERAALAAEIQQASKAGPQLNCNEGLVDLALAQMARLQEAAQNKDDRSGLRAVLQEMVSAIELWFDHKQVGRETRCQFARGLIYLRPDLRLNDLFNTDLSTAPNHGRSTRSGAPTRE
jgi:hypothetical protein